MAAKLLLLLAAFQISVCVDALYTKSVRSKPGVTSSLLTGASALNGARRRRRTSRRRRRSTGTPPSYGPATSSSNVAQIKTELKSLQSELKNLKSTMVTGLDGLAKAIAARPTSTSGKKCCKDLCEGGCFKGLFCCPVKGRCMDTKTRSTVGPNCDACEKEQSKDMEEEDEQLATICANEGGTCKCKGMVYYGKRFQSSRKPGSGAVTNLAQLKDSAFKEKAVNGQIACTTRGFGGDPTHGYYKHCMCIPGPSSTKDAAKPGKDVAVKESVSTAGGKWVGPLKGKTMSRENADPCPKPMRKRSNGVCSWVSKESHGYRTMELDEGVGIIKKACESSPGCGVFECTRAALG